MLAALIAAVLLAPAPDLQVATVSAPDTAATGGLLEVPTSVENAGARRAKRSRTRFWLSRDSARGGDVRLRAVRVPRLRAGATWGTTAKLHVPRETKPAAYHVIACADSGRVVRERREGNNCFASIDTVRVVTRTEPQIPPGPR